jgi:hypothetical protein
MRILGLGCAAVIGLSACDGPCRMLAERVCECQTQSPNEETACLIRLDANEDRSPTTAEEELCERQLDRCSCADIEQGRLETCGLSPEPNLPEDRTP